MWAYLDEADRAYWRKLAVEELDKKRQTEERLSNGFEGLVDRKTFYLDAVKYAAFSTKLDHALPTGPALKPLMKRPPLWES